MPNQISGLKAFCVNVLLVAVALAFILFLLEGIAGRYVHQYVRGLEHVDKMNDFRFIPNSEAHYKTGELEFVIKANRFGRRDADWPEAVLSDPDNILFIGDSFVLSYGVDQEDGLTDQMERIMASSGKPVEVFNFGINGSFDRYYRLLEESKNIGIKAETVIVGIFIGNDFSDLSDVRVSRSDDHGIVSSIRQSKLLFFLKMKLISSTTFINSLFKVSSLLGIKAYQTPAGYIYLRDQTADQRRLFVGYLEQIGKIKDLAEAQGRDIRFVIIPSKVQLENYESLNSRYYQIDRPNVEILVYCEKHQIRCYDLLPDLRQAYEMQEDLFYFPTDRHWNSKGIRAAAELITEKVVKASWN